MGDSGCAEHPVSSPHTANTSTHVRGQKPLSCIRSAGFVRQSGAPSPGLLEV